MSTRARLGDKSVLHTQNLAIKLLNYKTYINPFTSRVLDGVLYSHSNFLVCGQNPMMWPFKWKLSACSYQNSGGGPGQNCFSKFYEMKFGTLVEICFWQKLAVKGLKSTFQSRIAERHVLTRHLPEMWKIILTVSRLPWVCTMTPHCDRRWSRNKVPIDIKPLHCSPSPWKVVPHYRGLRLLFFTNSSVGSFIRWPLSHDLIANSSFDPLKFFFKSSADKYFVSTLSVDLCTTHFISSTKHIGYNKSSFEFDLRFCY